MSGDAVAGDPELDRIDRHLGQIDTEQIGQVAGGDGRHRRRRRRTGDGGSGSSGNGEHVLGDDPPSGSGAAHGGEGHAALGSNPPGIGRGELALTGGDRRRRGGRRGPRRRGWCVNRCGRHRGLGGWSLTCGEQPGDAGPAREHVARLAELVQRPGSGRADLGLGLVGFDQEDRLVGLDRRAVGDEPLDDHRLLHREPQLGHRDLSRHREPPSSGRCAGREQCRVP